MGTDPAAHRISSRALGWAWAATTVALVVVVLFVLGWQL
jgi:hypothetical protein